MAGRRAPATLGASSTHRLPLKPLPLKRLRRWIRDLVVVVYLLGVQSSLAVGVVAAATGVSFALAGSLIPPLGTTQLLRLFTLLSSESVGVLLTLLMVMIRAILPISLIMHLMEGWPAGTLRIGRGAVVVGAGVAAGLLFLEFLLISLLSLAAATDDWLDPGDLVAVFETLRPGLVLFSLLRVVLFASLCALAVLKRLWPLQPLGRYGHWGPSQPYDPWRPHQQLPMGHLLMAYTDLFRLVLIVIPLELAYQLSALPGSLTA